MKRCFRIRIDSGDWCAAERSTRWRRPMRPSADRRAAAGLRRRRSTAHMRCCWRRSFRDSAEICTPNVWTILAVIAPPPLLKQLIRLELVRGRQLDRGNAQPSSIGADFKRLDLDLRKEMHRVHVRTVTWKRDLEWLNEWRNAIVHEDFTSPTLGGIMSLRLRQVRRWRRSCGQLARAMDELTCKHMQSKTGTSPW